MPVKFTECDGGFVVERRLDDGRILVEGYVLVPKPWDGSDPHHAIYYTWITDSEAEAAAKADAFIRDEPLRG